MKKTFFVTRHAGAIAWAIAQGFEHAEMTPHFDPVMVDRGDVVLGTLPIHLVAEVNKRGGAYLHLILDLPAEARGRELTAEDMVIFGARLQRFDVATQDHATADVEVGEWYDGLGEYALAEVPAERSRIQSQTTEQGCVLKLVEPGVPTRDIYVERLGDAWRVNLTIDDENDIHTQIRINDTGELTIN
jgi:CRISPR-associated protein Csx16